MTRPFRPVKLVADLTLLGLLVLIVLNYQVLLDRYALASFKPSAEVAAIEPGLSLTEHARAVFYRSKPQIDAKVAFNTDCETSRGELELGCYYHNRIYILRIENASLAPEMSVVTAHELLHAAWDRLSSSERSRLTTQLEAAYAKINDTDLQQRMAGYAKSEPGQEANELHSILGTERAVLTPELETYYSRYFTNRAAIVAEHATYEGVFNSRRAELEQELGTIRSLKGQLAIVNRQLATYKNAGQIEQYNALVPRQNSMVDDINSRIGRYQTAVDEYNALSKSLDSQQITETESGVQ
jgi:hypothetical protein